MDAHTHSVRCLGLFILIVLVLLGRGDPQHWALHRRLSHRSAQATSQHLPTVARCQLIGLGNGERECLASCVCTAG